MGDTVPFDFRQELALLRIEHMGEEVRRRGMFWFHCPIIDVSTPDDDLEKTRETEGGTIRALLRSDDVLVHCRGGLERSGNDRHLASYRTANGASHSNYESACGCYQNTRAGKIDPRSRYQA